MRFILNLVGMVAVAGLVLGGCTSDDGARADRPLVVATTAILGDIVAEVAGDSVTVETLMPRGADPHSFEPSARQAARLRDADLLVVNGLGLEEGLLDAVDSARDDGVRVFELAPTVDPLPQGEPDPHVWMDPVRVAEGVGHLGDELAEIAPGVDWPTRVEQYREGVRRAHQQIEELLSDLPSDRRKLVTDHDSLSYFAARYGFEVIGTVVPGTSTLGAPSAGDLSGLAELASAKAVPAIFVETTQDRRLADALAREVGADVAVVPLFAGTLGEPSSPAGTYLGMLVTDARRIAEALS